MRRNLKSSGMNDFVKSVLAAVVAGVVVSIVSPLVKKVFNVA